MTDLAYAVATTAVEDLVPMTATCNAVSWSPEVISLYGDSNDFTQTE
ncbi:hypothetical protein SAMN05443582_111129 [Phyllobacterium sp. OV277]|nr:hypothetical protein SAMN05443582_111129 [Phyllobacterium sp. OV277]